MILSFKKQFEKPILDGIKIHTIREDKRKRWKFGNKIHFATGVRTKNYNQFKEGVCSSIQFIKIQYAKDSYSMPLVSINDECLPHDEVVQLAKNDGFKNLNEFLNWFSEDFEGKIIHWTNHLY